MLRFLNSGRLERSRCGGGRLRVFVFFAYYGGLRLNAGLSYSAQVPTKAQLGGDFSAGLSATQLGTDCLGRPILQGQIYNPYSLATCPNGSAVRNPYPGNIIPTTGVGGIDALANTFATGNYWPAPKNPGGGFNFNTTVGAPTTSNEWGIRIDHNFNPEEWGSINGDQGGAGIRNFYDLKADWSVDGENIVHSLVMNYVYELPFGRGKKFGGDMNKAVDAVAGGWQIAGITTVQSGFPMSIGPGTNSESVFGGNQHAQLTGQPFHSGHCGGTNGVPVIPVGTKYCFFNPAAFEAPAEFTFGNAPRYFSNLSAPGYVNQDFTFAKTFQMIAEKLRLQVGLQMFNAFNHANFEIPSATVGSPTMGMSSGTQGARQMQGLVKLTY